MARNFLIMRDVHYGWLIRYLHANVASFFFIFVYLHIGRGLYYGSYRSPRTLVWSIGVIILVLMMATAFLGYVLPYGYLWPWAKISLYSVRQLNICILAHSHNNNIQYCSRRKLPQRIYMIYFIALK